MKQDSNSFTPTELAAFAALGVPYAALARCFYFVTDDAFITFRYARNLMQGFGPVYNPGAEAPVDGCSSFLWMLICSGVERLGGDMELWPPLLTFICGLVLLLLVFGTLLKRFGLPLWSAWLSAFFLASLPPFFVWSTSGLETMAYALVMFGVFDRLFLRQGGPAPFQAGALGVILVLIRSEGICWALVLAVLCAFYLRLSGKKVLRPVLIFSGMALLGYLCWLLWHYSFYGTLTSNAARAKIILRPVTLGRGFDYLWAQHFEVPSLLLVIPGALLVLRGERRALGLPVAAMALGVVCFSLAVGGDHMAFARFLAPGLAFDALLFGWIVTDISSLGGARKAAAGAAVCFVAVAGFLPAFDLHLVPHSIRSFRTSFPYRLHKGELLSERGRWLDHKHKALRWKALGLRLKDYAEPGDTLVAGAIGAKGYYSELFIYDQCGLVNRRVADRDGFNAQDPPGHQKCVSFSFFLDKKPDIAWAELFPLPLVRQAVQDLESSPYSDQYAPHIEAVPEYRADEDHYMVLFRRLGPGEDPAAAWSRAMEQLGKME